MIARIIIALLLVAAIYVLLRIFFAEKKSPARYLNEAVEQRKAILKARNEYLQALESTRQDILNELYEACQKMTKGLDASVRNKVNFYYLPENKGLILNIKKNDTEPLLSDKQQTEPQTETAASNEYSPDELEKHNNQEKNIDEHASLSKVNSENFEIYWEFRELNLDDANIGKAPGKNKGDYILVSPIRTRIIENDYTTFIRILSDIIADRLV